MLRTDEVPDAAPPAGLGHNGGPPIEEPLPRPLGLVHNCWKRAHRAAWRNPGRKIMLRRLKRAA
jgi:hypothetical protein